MQRARMLAAAVDLIAGTGYAELTVARVVERSGVSRRTFYEAFSDREDCFLAVFEHALAEASLLAREAYDRESGWRDGIRAALARLLLLIDDEPTLARVCLVETLAGGERVLARRMRLLADLARAVDGGRALARGQGEPSPLSAEGVVGGVLAVIHSRLLERTREPFVDLVGPLMSMIVMPYLGAKAARRELTRPARRPAPAKRVTPSAPDGDRLAGLNLRVTYRTMRVVAVIAENPGASNREVAEGSGIVDAGQVSKLLSRLAGLGLIENFGAGAARGSTNAWRLTKRGERLGRAARSTLA
jgi:AcrR family transcriptional regulator